MDRPGRAKTRISSPPPNGAQQNVGTRVTATPPRATQPAAPPVYRPQAAPKVLQRQTAPGQSRQVPSSSRPIGAPVAFNPQTKGIVQSKTTAAAQKPPQAPPVYRPQPAPKVLQRKAANVPERVSASRPAPAAPAPYRPNPSPKVLQAKMVTPPMNAARTSVAAPLAHSSVDRTCAASGHSHLSCGPHAGVRQTFGAIQLSSGKKAKKQKEKPKASGVTKSGKLTKKAQKKLAEKEELAAAKGKAEQEKEQEREWKEKARLGQKKEMAKEWETNKEFFNRWAGSVSASPPNTIACRYPIPIIDLRDIRADNPHLASLIEFSLEKIQVRPNTPEHGNREGKLPGYNALLMPMAYLEYSFLGGGGRLVVDAVAGIVYICAHYSYYYQLVIDGAAPTHPVEVATSQRTMTLELLNVEYEEPVVVHLPVASSLSSSSSSSSMVSPRRSSLSPPRSPSLISPRGPSLSSPRSPSLSSMRSRSLLLPPTPENEAEELVLSVVGSVLQDDDDDYVPPLRPPSATPPINQAPVTREQLEILYGEGSGIWARR